jgi:2-polyprenyl-3-methyl-5-hydroxy-6-metoxy-1,4-benzoquinol methylase
MTTNCKAVLTGQNNAVDEPSRAPKQYWNSIWETWTLPRPIDPENRSLRHHVYHLEFHSLFRDTFAKRPRSEKTTSLLELGCACSVWLPYFSKEFGFRVTGIDYSATGCDQARAILARERVDGEVVCADIFQAPATLLSGFDYVFSFGVVEHFEATDRCLATCASFLKPGGLMITVIPNMNGSVGLLQKWLDREVFDVHVPLDTEALRHAHETAGLDVITCKYFCFSNYGVLNLERIRRTFLGLWLSRALQAVSAVTWAFERVGVKFSANKMTSPYVVCVSTTKAKLQETSKVVS